MIDMSNKEIEKEYDRWNDCDNCLISIQHNMAILRRNDILSDENCKNIYDTIRFKIAEKRRETTSKLKP
jgi:hypothetical protein